MHIIPESCRVCLGKQRLKDIFQKNLLDKIKYCAAIELSEDDGLPKMICTQCLFYLDVAYIFRTVCEATDQRLRQHLKKQNEERLRTPVKEHNGGYHYVDLKVGQERKVECVRNIVVKEKFPKELRDFRFIDVANKVIVERLQEQKHLKKLVLGRNFFITKEKPLNRDFRFPSVVNKVIVENVQEREEEEDRRLKQLADVASEVAAKEKLLREKNKEEKIPLGDSREKDKKEKTSPRDSSQVKEKLSGEKTPPRDFHFIEVANEVVIGESPEKESEEIVLAGETESPKSDKMGRHTARKKSAKIAKKIPTVQETFIFDEITNIRELQTVEKPAEPNQCSQCDKVFAFRSQLDRHVTSHKTKVLCCQHCDKKFPTRLSLANHVRQHAGGIPLKCVICNKEFATPTLLQKHRNSHAPEAPFQCKHCPKKLAHASSLKLHEKMHNKPKHPCEVCWRTFRTKSALAEHRRGHKDVCGTCGKIFANKGSLQRHSKQHKFNFTVRLKADTGPRQSKKGKKSTKKALL